MAHTVASNGDHQRRAVDRIGLHVAVEVEHAPHELRVHDRRRGAFGDEPAVAHGHEMMAVARRVVEVVEHDHDGAAVVGVQVDQQVEYVHLVGDVCAGFAEASSARLIGVDRLGMDLVAVVPNGPQPACVNFDDEQTTSEGVRKAVVALLVRARSAGTQS